MLVIAGLVGTVWGAVVFLRGGLLAGCLTVLLAGCCFGHAFYNVPTGSIPLTADRLLFLLLFVQLVVWKRFGWTNSTRLLNSDIVLCLFLLALMVSTFTHDWRFANSMPLARFVFFFGMPFGLYVVARQVVQTERGTHAMHIALALFGAYLAMTAIAETRQWTALVFPPYIMSPKIPEFLGRGRGPFLNPVACGFFQCACLSAALVWWPKLSARMRFVVAMLTGLVMIGVYYTLTRSAWMGGALSVLVVAACLLPRRWKVPLVGGTVAMALLMVAIQWSSLVAFKRDKGLSAEETLLSAKLRPVLAAIAWQMFLDRPLLGCGFGQYLNNNVDYINDRTIDLPLAAGRPYVQHNTWLSLLTETGLVGMGLFTVLTILWTRHAWQLWSQADAPDWARRQALWMLAVLATILPSAVFQDTSIIPMVDMLLFFGAGLTESLAAQFVPVRGAAIVTSPAVRALQTSQSASLPTSGIAST